MITEFLKYPHLERFGNVEVEGIEHGAVYVFPKIDGTIDKEYNKIALNGWSSKNIPQLLETVYRCIVVEELYDYLKKHNGTINFKTLKHFVTAKVKELKKELF